MMVGATMNQPQFCSRLAAAESLATLFFMSYPSTQESANFLAVSVLMSSWI